jgi:hypothetical protein
MLTKTDKGKTIRKYYLKVESLASKTYEIISEIKSKIYEEKAKLAQEQITKDFEQKLKIEKEKYDEQQKKLIFLNNYVETKKNLQHNEIIYIATSDQYANNNRFKVGGSEKEAGLTGRLNVYNTGKAKEDLFYYVFTIKVNDYKQIENKLKILLDKHLDSKNKELYIINYEELVLIIEFLCKNLTSEVDYIKINGERMVDRTLHEICDLSDHKHEIYHNKNFKTNISEYTEEQINNIILILTPEFIEKFNNNKTVIKWSEYAKFLESKVSNLKRSKLKVYINDLLKSLNLTVIFK